MAGGYDFTLSKFNNATQAYRQTGSAFKPYI
jgi:penicillin-binding protein 1A